MISNTNGFGGVVIYKNTLSLDDFFSDPLNLELSDNLVFHKGWVGENPESDPTEYDVERTFGYGKKKIYDKMEISFSIMAYDMKKNSYSYMRKLNNIVSWAWARGNTGRYVWVCPRFDFNGEDKPTFETMINNKFYACYIVPPFKIEDIGNSGAGERVKINFMCIDYVDDFDVDLIAKNIYLLQGTDGSVTYNLTGKDSEGTEFTLYGIE